MSAVGSRQVRAPSPQAGPPQLFLVSQQLSTKINRRACLRPPPLTPQKCSLSPAHFQHCRPQDRASSCGTAPPLRALIFHHLCSVTLSSFFLILMFLTYLVKTPYFLFLFCHCFISRILSRTVFPVSPLLFTVSVFSSVSLPPLCLVSRRLARLREAPTHESLTSHLLR